MFSTSKLMKFAIPIATFIFTLSLYKTICLIDQALIELSLPNAVFLLLIIIPLGLFKLFELTFGVVIWFIKTWRDNNSYR